LFAEGQLIGGWFEITTYFGIFRTPYQVRAEKPILFLQLVV